MQKLQRHCSLALQLLRSVRTTSSTAKIHLFLLPSRGKSGSKSHPFGLKKRWWDMLAGQHLHQNLMHQYFLKWNSGVRTLVQNVMIGPKVYFLEISYSEFHRSFRKYSNNAYYINKKKSNTCLRAVWWRFRDLNTNESHFYEKEAIGHSFTRFCCLKSQETNLLMKFGIPAWCQATTRSCKLNFKLKDSDLCLVRTMKYNSMFFYQDVPIQ